jgi:PAS domain S-box-containing protein
MHFDGFVAFSRSPSSRWAVVLGAPSALVMEPLQRSFLLIAAVAACALVGYIAASAFAGRVARPLLGLVASVNVFSRKGTMPTRLSGAVSEVEHARRALEEAARAIESRDVALRESESRFRQLAENIDAVFWVTDFPDRKVVYVSPAYERLWGMSAARLYTEPREWIQMIHPDDRPRAEALFVDRVREGSFDAEYRILTPDGRLRWVRDRGFPVRDADGNIRRVAGIAEDITDRKRAEMTLSENRMVLGLALDTAQIGVWDHDFLTDEMRMDGTAKALFGFAPEATLTYQRWVSVLHPDDLPVVESIRARALRTQGEFAAEYRVVRTDKTTRWVSMVGRGWFHQPGGKPLRMIGVVLDITERRRAEEDRVALLERERAARAEAESANHIKDEFLAMLGHELRNPLGAISNAVQVLGEVGIPSDRGRRLREIISRQTRHLARLIEDLLDVSRLTSGKIVLERRHTDLLEVTERCLASLAEAGRTTAHAVSLAGEPTIVDGDATRLEQIVANLVDNAVKYTPRGGAIRVTVGAEHGEAVLKVADTGVGIEPELLTRVFELFVQDRRSLHRAGGGLGLGLTLVKRLVDLHGGTVWVQSDGLGRGSSFVVRLPLVPGTTDLQPRSAPATASAPPTRVLVVEDHEDARASLRLLLSLDGHEVEEAEDGHVAFEKIMAWRPDVALVDIGLPGLDGYALARAVRAAPGGKGLFLVALTGYGQPQDRKRAIEAGFDAHLVKPVEPDRLKEILGSERSG